MDLGCDKGASFVYVMKQYTKDPAHSHNFRNHPQQSDQ